MIFDVIIVGGSFSGLSAGLQLARARQKILIIDSGKPRNIYAEATHGILGHDRMPPTEIIDAATRQLLLYPSVEILKDTVLDAEKIETGFLVELANGDRRQARRLILATGIKDTLPDIPGMKEKWGISVLHCPYCHGFEYRDQPLGVLSDGSPMSAHKASLIPDWGPTTYFTLSERELDENQRRLLASRSVNIESSPVAALIGEGQNLEAVELKNGKKTPLNALFISPVTHISSPLAEQLGCEFDEGPLGLYIRTDDWNQTTIPGVYAAGDAATPMHTATFACASGVQAGVGAHQASVFNT